MWIFYSINLPNSLSGRRKSSVGLICILEFLKNNKDIFIFALHLWGCRKKNVGVQEETASIHLYWPDHRRMVNLSSNRLYDILNKNVMFLKLKLIVNI